MTYRIAFFIFLVSLNCVGTFAQTALTANKTFSKSLNTDGKGTILLDLPGTVDLKVWENPTIKVEISISLPNGSSAMLNELATIGRYNLSTKSSGDVLTVHSPNLQKQVKVKGEVLKENLTYIVFVPKNLKVTIKAPEVLAVGK